MTLLSTLLFYTTVELLLKTRKTFLMHFDESAAISSLNAYAVTQLIGIWSDLMPQHCHKPQIKPRHKMRAMWQSKPSYWILDKHLFCNLKISELTGLNHVKFIPRWSLEYNNVNYVITLLRLGWFYATSFVFPFRSILPFVLRRTCNNFRP